MTLFDAPDLFPHADLQECVRKLERRFGEQYVHEDIPLFQQISIDIPPEPRERLTFIWQQVKYLAMSEVTDDDLHNRKFLPTGRFSVRPQNEHGVSEPQP